VFINNLPVKIYFFILPNNATSKNKLLLEILFYLNTTLFFNYNVAGLLYINIIIGDKIIKVAIA
jgi:hypothetical protein